MSLHSILMNNSNNISSPSPSSSSPAPQNHVPQSTTNQATVTKAPQSVTSNQTSAVNHDQVSNLLYLLPQLIILHDKKIIHSV